MYDIDSIYIAGLLLVTLLLAIEAGYRIGRAANGTVDGAAASQISSIQTSILGILALLLAFTFSLSLQRYETRSKAVVDEANAIGTAYLRVQLLPESVRDDVQRLMRDYIDQRIQASSVTLADDEERILLVAQASNTANAIWGLAMQAAAADPNPVTSGLYIQAFNTVIDALGTRNAELERHVPEPVLLLLYLTFVLAGAILGYASGVAGHRVTFATYVMVGLIVVLVFTIVDLDRPRRGLIQIDQSSLVNLKAQFGSGADTELSERPRADENQ